MFKALHSRKVATLFVSIFVTMSTTAQATSHRPMARKELQEISWLRGTWSCAGNVTVTTPQGPQSQKVNSTYFVQSTLGGYWLTGRMASPKSRENPMPHVETDMWTYNPVEGTYYRSGFDNYGDRSSSNAPRINSSELSFQGTATAFGYPAAHSVKFHHIGKGKMTIDVLIGAAETPIVEAQYTCTK